MNDGTYNNASDPNSMMDQGISRNAVYNAEANYFTRSDSKNKSRKYIQYMPRDGQINNTFYSFGGKRPISHAVEPEISVLPYFKETCGYSVGRVSQAHKVKYNREPLQRVQDYTKNISQTIFSPGLVPRTKHAQTLLNRTVSQPRNKSTSRQRNPAVDLLRQFDKKINAESSKKKKLSEDIEVLKQNIKLAQEAMKKRNS